MATLLEEKGRHPGGDRGLPRHFPSRYEDDLGKSYPAAAPRHGRVVEGSRNTGESRIQESDQTGKARSFDFDYCVFDTFFL